mgnify:CR=1 FL=1
MYPIIILPELQPLIPPLTPAEYRQLEANLLKEGRREPLSVAEDIDAYFGTREPLVSAYRGRLFRHIAATCYGRGRVVRRRGSAWLLRHECGG